MVGTFSLINIQWQSFQSFNNEWAFNYKWVWKIWMFWDLTICRQFGWSCSMCQLHFQKQPINIFVRMQKKILNQQRVCFEWGHSTETIRTKEKHMPATPNSTNNVLSWKIITFYLLSEKFCLKYICEFQFPVSLKRSLKLFFQYKLLNKTSQNFATFKRHPGTFLQKLS